MRTDHANPPRWTSGSEYFRNNPPTIAHDVEGLLRMSRPINRSYRLRRRPQGSVTAEDLEFVEDQAPEPRPGEALVRTLWLSLDPSNRIWMSDTHYSLPPVPINGVMRGLGIGQVAQSRRDDLAVGELVTGVTGWQDYVIADHETTFTAIPEPHPEPLTALLGPLGHTGVTAYLGVQDIGKPEPGETMVVSAAAGAVGSVAGQIGKARGARVVGIAGSPSKCQHVVEDLGFDACVDRRDPEWRKQLDVATPEGIDVDFENAGGPIMDHILTRLNVGARVVLCGLIAEYDSYGSPTGGRAQPDIAQALMVKRALMRSFLVLDNEHRFPEAVDYLSSLIVQNKLKYEQTIIDGLGRAREALSQMFEGANTGKLLIKVADPQA